MRGLGETIADYSQEVAVWAEAWKTFKEVKPFREGEYNKRNWGHSNHSLCSFFGKLKPSISYYLVKTFSSESETVFDCFSGSGTIPFEAALNGRHSFGLDINPISIILSRAKVSVIELGSIQTVFDELKRFLNDSVISPEVLDKAQHFGYNKTLEEYYHPLTFIEILKAREFFKEYEHKNGSYYFVLSCLLHILHGNRPYALSRNSHPITPYAPTGEFQYKSLTNKLHQKVDRAYKDAATYPIVPGLVFEGDILDMWPSEIKNVNAIITSPPFFDSTKYYLTNWLRSWFLGWEFEDFEREKTRFVDTKQKKTFDIYDSILCQSKERLAANGVVVFHLGKSSKKDMGMAIMPYAKKYFNRVELYNEDVSNIEKHGIKDKGSVDNHQYLVMY